MDPLTAPSSTSATIMTDLNDYCLQEVFKYLELTDLCAVADVCYRFRQNAKCHFASPKFKNDVFVVWIHSTGSGISLEEHGHKPDSLRIMHLENIPVGEILLRISRFLRNFGMLIRFAKIHENKCQWVQKIFHLISLYCSGTLIGLEIWHSDITGEIERAMRPLLLHLKRLTLSDCVYSELFGKMLSLWAPVLRELHFSSLFDFKNRWSSYNGTSEEMRVDTILRQYYPKLEAISIQGIANMRSDDMDDFMKLNRQLKRIGLVNCPNVDGSIFRSIATHVPDIEGIQINRVSTINDTNLKYCGTLNNLNTLKLCFSNYIHYNHYPPDDSFIPSILYEITAGNIPLQQLHMLGLRQLRYERFDQLFATISKVKTLQTLWIIYFPGLKTSHILDVCKNLKQLKELKLDENEIKLSSGDLLKLVKNAEQLQSLHYSESLIWNKLELENQPQKYLEKLLTELDPQTEHSENERLRNGLKRLGEVFKLINGPNARAHADYARNCAIFKPFVDFVKIDGKTNEIWIDAYKKIVQVVQQRRGGKCLLIKLNATNPLIVRIPKDLSRQYADVLRMEVLPKPLFPVFYLDQLWYDIDN